jgi:hypothetical protein
MTGKTVSGAVVFGFKIYRTATSAWFLYYIISSRPSIHQKKRRR